MVWFRRGRRQQETDHRRDGVPGEVAFFDGAAWLTFCATVDGCLDRRGEPYRRLGTRLAVGEPPSEGSLVTLAQRCFHAEPTSWSRIVEQHFSALLDRPLAELLPADGDAARTALRVRLVAEDWVDAARRPATLSRPFADGLLAALFVDLPASVASVGPRDLHRWDLDLYDAFDVGYSNVRDHEPVAIDHTDLGNGVAVTALTSDSFFCTTHAVWLDDLVAPMPAQGALVILPHRHAVIVHRLLRSGPARAALDRLAEAARSMHLEGPGSLTPDLYWWRPGNLVRLGVRSGLGAGPVRRGPVAEAGTDGLPEPFARMLDSLPR